MNTVGTPFLVTCMRPPFPGAGCCAGHADCRAKDAKRRARRAFLDALRPIRAKSRRRP